MKHSQLRSVAHSIADSLASGISIMTGFYDLALYDDAMRSEDGTLVIDLLNGKMIKGSPSPALASAVLRVPAEFDRLCHAQGISRKDCRKAEAHFHTRHLRNGFMLKVEDRFGKSTETAYEGIPARRVSELDLLGRIRRKPVHRT